LRSWPEVARRIRVPLGFAFAVLYLWLAQPSWKSLLIGFPIVALGLVLRALASGHVRKNTELTMTGPYAYTRHPLYAGSILMAVGFAVAARSLWIVFGLAVLFIAIYVPVIRSEEAYLAEHFPSFGDYARQVPALFPRLRPAGRSRGAFSRELYLQHREYNAFAGALLMLALLIAKILWR
jgi:protein-S-isoprenylcysteine O-methyltransferase Ste14